MVVLDHFFSSMGIKCDPLNTFYIFILMISRLSPLVWLVPWLGLRMIPSVIRIAMVGGLGTGLLPSAMANSSFSFTSYPAFFTQIFFEILFGIFFGLLASLPIYAVSWAGSYSDLWGRSSFANSSVDLEGNQNSALSIFSLLLGIFIFISIDGHLRTLELLLRSMDSIPLGTFSPFHSFSILFESIQRLISWSFELSLRIVFPVFLIAVFVDTAMGWMSRSTQSLTTFMLHLPIKSLLSLGAFFFVILTWEEFLPLNFSDGLHFIGQILKLIQKSP